MMRLALCTIALFGFGAAASAGELDRETAPPTGPVAAPALATTTAAPTGTELDRESPQLAHHWHGGWGGYRGFGGWGYGGYRGFGGYGWGGYRGFGGWGYGGYGGFYRPYYAGFYRPYYPGFGYSFAYGGLYSPFYSYAGFGPAWYW